MQFAGCMYKMSADVKKGHIEIVESTGNKLGYGYVYNRTITVLHHTVQPGNNFISISTSFQCSGVG